MINDPIAGAALLGFVFGAIFGANVTLIAIRYIIVKKMAHKGL